MPTPSTDNTQADELPWFSFDTLQVGEELGSVEYVLTEATFAQFREAVEDADATWVTNALKPDALVAARRWKYRPGERHINARHKAQYFTPPRPGQRLIMTGRVKDKYIKRDKPYVVTEVEVTDSDGVLIERYERTRMASAPALGRKWWGGADEDTPIGFSLSPLVKHMTFEKMKFFESLTTSERGHGTHDSEQAALEEGFRAPIASGHMTLSYTHELLDKFLGKDWVRGGTLDLKFIRPVLDGDTITLGGTVTDKITEDGGVRLLVNVWAENQKSEKVAVGEASGLVAARSERK